MTATSDTIFAAAMSLDVNLRRELAERLWDTVETSDDSVFSEETWSEIGRRVAASDCAEIEHVPGDVALAQVRAEFGLAPAA